MIAITSNRTTSTASGGTRPSRLPCSPHPSEEGTTSTLTPPTCMPVRPSSPPANRSSVPSTHVSVPASIKFPSDSYSVKFAVTASPDAAARPVPTVESAK